MIVTPQETFLTLSEAAEALGMHAETLRAEADAGTIRGAKIGKQWRFRASVLADHMRTIEEGGTSSRSGSTRAAQKARSMRTSASAASEIADQLAQARAERRSASRKNAPAS